MRALLLSGGGLRGLVQVPAIRHVAATGPIDLVCGTSVGAINALAVGREAKLALWDRIRRPKDIQKVKDWNPMDGVYSLDPAIDLIRAEGMTTGLKVPTYVGTIHARTGAHALIRVDNLPEADTADAVRCSASILPFPHEVARYRGSVYTDGGELHVLPPLPVEYADTVTEIHAVFCSPVTKAGRGVRSEADVSTVLELAAAKLDDQVTRNVLGDLRRLQVLARKGVKVYVYAPETMEAVGPTFKVDEALIALRKATGERMVQTVRDL